ncbi:interleukin-13 receptor subunit alpha-2 isoform X1 [Centroberyx gerrardi]
MAGKTWLTRGAALMLFLLNWSQCMQFTEITVDPPEDLVIFDPGHLGLLQIQWSPAASLLNMTDCQQYFQLEYFNTYQDRWTAIRTTKRTYSAQFDLGKAVEVRVYTLLRGSCSSGSEVKSARYTELVQKPDSTGLAGTKVQDFVCVFHKMEYIQCNWERGPKQPANSHQRLYFWHKQLEQTKECPKYIIANGVRSGCNFTRKSLLDFIDINFCVNGSSPGGPLKPAFISLQIQNHVKPAVTETLHLQAGPDRQLELHWECPVGRVPKHCLEWEVERNQEGPDGNNLTQQILTKEMNLTLLSISDTKRNCFRVRSRLHKYCANKGFWSDWSHWTCHPDEKVTGADPGWDVITVCVHVAVAVITLLLLSLCVWALFRVWRSRQVKKLDSLATTLFASKSVVTVVEP